MQTDGASRLSCPRFPGYGLGPAGRASLASGARSARGGRLAGKEQPPRSSRVRLAGALRLRSHRHAAPRPRDRSRRGPRLRRLPRVRVRLPRRRDQNGSARLRPRPVHGAGAALRTEREAQHAHLRDLRQGLPGGVARGPGDRSSSRGGAREGHARANRPLRVGARQARREEAGELQSARRFFEVLP